MNPRPSWDALAGADGHPGFCHPEDAGFWTRPRPCLLLPWDWHDSLDPIWLVTLASCPDDALVFASSGSTGTPKLTVLRRSALLASARMVVDWLGLNASDHLLRALPVHHVGGLGLLARAHLSGSRYSSLQGKWDAGEFTREITERRASVVSLVPTQVHDIVARNLRAPGCLRIAVAGGGALPAKLAGAALALDWPLRRSFGMTESASQIATEHPDHTPPGPDWLPVLPGWDTTTTPCGLLRIRGEGLFSGRLVSEAPGAWRYEPADLENGWFTTADRIEWRRENGHQWLRPLGRADDTIKILGELYSLSALQLQLEQDALSLGLDPGRFAISCLPDPRAGNRLVLAACQPQSSAADSLLRRFNDHATGPPRLHSCLLVDAIPRTPLGKIAFPRLCEILTAPLPPVSPPRQG